MSVVAVQSAPLGLHQQFHPRHSAAPPASLTASVSKRPGIITLSKPIQRTPPRPRKSTPSHPTPAPTATPKFEKARKPRSRPTSDEDDQESPKARGRRNQEKAPSPKPRTRQTPSPESEPVLQKPSGRLAKQRKGFTKSTPALCTAVAASAPVPVPQVTSSAPSGLSRSAPLSTPMSQSLPARMRRTLTGPRDDPAPKDVPASPSPRRVRESSNKGPLTAPLHGVFPRPAHNRSPSEALFNLSLDETDDEPQDMPILFGRRGGDKVYAGGRFQNGPDTTTLPAPSFLAGF